jgi:hypothetical protein
MPNSVEGFVGLKFQDLPVHTKFRNRAGREFKKISPEECETIDSNGGRVVRCIYRPQLVYVPALAE